MAESDYGQQYGEILWHYGETPKEWADRAREDRYFIERWYAERQRRQAEREKERFDGL